MSTQTKLDTFTRAYIEAALFSSAIDPFGTCPQCGKDDQVLCRWDDDREHVCSACSEREPDYEPPADDNYSVSDISEDALVRMAADCERFQVECAELITEDNCSRCPGECSVTEYAGHDFWLTRNGHGAGFWDGDWSEPAATKLDEASKRMGECDLYVGDDGKLYLS